ncbi:MAG: hypothetical protein CMH54_04885 [Myxococcales bacterium]|nr:hypothetical protein [Myxococcales bacterium]
MARKRTKKPGTDKKKGAAEKKPSKVVQATPPSEHQTDELPGWWAAMERAFSAFERAASQAPTTVEEKPVVARTPNVEISEKAVVETAESTLDTDIYERRDVEPTPEEESGFEDTPEDEGALEEEAAPVEAGEDTDSETGDEPVFERIDPVEMLIVDTPADEDPDEEEAPPPIPERLHRPLLPISDPAVEALLEDVHSLFTLGDVNGALISLERVVMLTNGNERVDSFLERNEERLLELFDHVFDGFDQNVRTVENPNAIGPDFRDLEQVSKVWAAVVERHRLRDVMDAVEDSPVRVAAVLHHLLRTRRIQFSD